MSRALTTAEKTKLRSNGQASDVFLAVWQPATVFTARINQTFSSYDNIVEITIDGASGAISAAWDFYTVYIGTTAGARDIGVTYLRAAASTTTLLKVGASSRIKYADNQYITVVDSGGVWARSPYIEDEILYMDGDIAYTDENENFLPSPSMGMALLTPLFLSGGSVAISPNASGTYVTGTTVSSYFWTTSGGAIENQTTATPTITFSAAGQYIVTCTVALGNGASLTGYRRVVVYDDDAKPYRVSDARAKAQDGYQFQGVLNEAVNLEPHAAVCLFARDYFGGVESVIAANDVSGLVLSTGWIDEKNTVISSEDGSMSFVGYSAEYWLGKLASAPIYFHNVTGAAKWTEVENLTVDRALLHIFTMRSNAAYLCDITYSANTAQTPRLYSNTQTIGDQIAEIASRIFATVKCDRYGGIIIQRDTQYIAEANRSSIPVIMELADGDWVDMYEVPTAQSKPISFTDASGVTLTEHFYARSGVVFDTYGSTQNFEELIVTDESELVTLTGLAHNVANNPYPRVALEMVGGANKVIDIAPLQLVTLSLNNSDNVGNIAWASKTFIPRKLTYAYNDKAGAIALTIELEATIEDGIAESYERPQTPLDNYPPMPEIATNDDFDDFPILPIGGIYDPAPPDVVPQPPDIESESCETDAEANGEFDLHMSGAITSSDYYSKRGSIRCAVRSAAHTNKTMLTINGNWYKRESGTGNWILDDTDDSWYNVYAIGEDGDRVATGVKQTITNPFFRSFVFEPPSTVNVIGFSLALIRDTPQLFDPSAATMTTTTSIIFLDLTYSDYHAKAIDNGIQMNGQTTWYRSRTYGSQPQIKFHMPFLEAHGENYFDISYQFSVSGNRWRKVELRPSNSDNGNLVTKYAYSGYDDDPAYENSLEALRMNYVIGDYSGLTADLDASLGTGTYNILFSITARQAAWHKVVINSANVFNICATQDE